MKTVTTDVLEIAYEDGGPAAGSPILLLHGWPDAPRAWLPVAEELHAGGYRTIAPYWRGFGPTRFLAADAPRDGQAVPLAQDVIDLADRLGLQRFAVVGHDWGARVAYTLAALFPDRVTKIAALSLGYQPYGLAKTPESFEQSRRLWYQWFMSLDGGMERVAEDPIGFAHMQWETWGPQGWFEEAEFAKTAESFRNPDWLAITRNAYRSRWREGEVQDPRYAELRARRAEVGEISTPTLMIQGAADNCAGAGESEQLEEWFTGGYRRLVLDGVGHFPHREAPQSVADAVLHHLR